MEQHINMKQRIDMKSTMLIVLAGAFVLGGCTKDELSDKPHEAGEISFESGIQTKAPVTGVQFGSGAKVGVYTLESTDASNPTWTDQTGGAANILLMNNTECTANGNGGLSYSPAKLYKENAKYSFFAYYPYTETITAPSAGQSPRLACTFHTTPASQTDYMYATPLEGQAPTDNAKLLQFNHALTQITIKLVNGTENALTLNSLKVKAPGGATLNISDGTWSSPAADAVFNLYGPTSGASVASGASFSVPEQLMLLPVAASGTAYTFDMNVTEAGGSAQDKNNNTLTLPADGLKPGYSYEYKITYGNNSSIHLSTSVVDWQYVDGPGINVK